MIAATTVSFDDKNDTHSSDLSALFKAALRGGTPPTPTAEQLGQWKRLGEQLGGASWGGASSPA